MNRDVRLEIEGSLLERLLQRAAGKGAVFSEVRRVSGRKICVCADEGSAAILLELCRRYGLNCRVLSRGGRSGLKRALRARWTALLGVALCIAVCWAVLGRIWRIDVVFTGPAAQLGRRKQILYCLEESGISAGMARFRIDTALLQKQLMAGAGDYSFIGVRKQGVRLLVEAAPETPSPEVYSREYARDLVAERDGVVTAVNVKSGTAAVKPGDTVRRGQVLIRGEEAVAKDAETGEDITTGVAALGEVNARCWFEGRAEGYLLDEVSQRTGERRESARLRLPGGEISIRECEHFSSEETETQILPVVGLYLPVEIERSIHWETKTEIYEMEADALAGRLSPLAHAQARAALPPDCSFSCWEERIQDGSSLRIRAVYEICTDIAVSRDALQAQIEEVY